MSNKMIKLGFSLFITLVLWNISLADVPNYWLVPEDGYVRPEPVDVKLKWEKIQKKDIPAEIIKELYRSSSFRKVSEFPVVKIDLNNDGVLEWIIEDVRFRERVGAEYECFQQGKDGKFHCIGSFLGLYDFVYKPKNGYYQLECSGRSGMMMKYFSVFAFNPEKRKYERIRYEWHDFDNFTCKITGKLPGKHPKEWLLSRLETALRSAVKKHFENRIDQGSITFKRTGFRYNIDGKGFSLFIDHMGLDFDMVRDYSVSTYPLTAFGLKDQAVYFMRHKKYDVLWADIKAWLNLRMPVWSSAWFKLLPEKLSDSPFGAQGIYLGTVQTKDVERFPGSRHPFINYVLTDVSDMTTGVPLSRNIFLAFDKAELSSVKPGMLVVVYTKPNALRSFISHVKQWIYYDALKNEDAQ